MKPRRYFAVEGVERFSATTPEDALYEWTDWTGRLDLHDTPTVVIHEYEEQRSILNDLAQDFAIDCQQYLSDYVNEDHWPEMVDPSGDGEFLSSDGTEELVAGMKALLHRVLSRHATVWHCEIVSTKTHRVADLLGAV